MGSSPDEDTNHAIGIGFGSACRRCDYARRMLLLPARGIWTPARWRLRTSTRVQRTGPSAARRIWPAAGRRGRWRAAALAGAKLRTTIAERWLRASSARSAIWSAVRERGLCCTTARLLGRMVRETSAQMPQTCEAGSKSSCIWAAPGRAERPPARRKFAASTAVKRASFDKLAHPSAREGGSKDEAFSASPPPGGSRSRGRCAARRVRA